MGVGDSTVSKVIMDIMNGSVMSIVLGTPPASRDYESPPEVKA